MNISCPKCGKKYKIPDEKIKGKTVKLRCKGCNSLIYIRDPALGSPSVFLGRQTKTTKPTSPPLKQAKTQIKWYAVYKGKRIGPFTSEELLGKLKEGVLTPSSHVWRKGMPKWRKMSLVSELKDVLHEFETWKETQSIERTIVTNMSPPIEPPSAPKIELKPKKEPPPLPPSSQVKEPSSVSDLFQGASIPALPPQEDSAGSKQADILAELKEEIHKEETPFFPEDTGGSKADETSDAGDLIEESSEVKKFFESVQSMALEPSEPDFEQQPPKKVDLQEFSVLYRLQKETHKNRLLTISLSLIGLLVIIGAVVYFISNAPEQKMKEQMEKDEQQLISEKLIIPKYAVKKDDNQAQHPELKAENKHKEQKNRRNRHRSVRVRKTADIQKKWIPKKKISKKALKEAQLLASLLDKKTKRAKVDVKIASTPVTSVPQPRLTVDGLKEFIRHNGRKLSRCARYKTIYKNRLLDFHLNFTVGVSGRVTAVQIEQPEGLEEPKMFNCVKGIVRKWIFPKPKNKKPISVSIPLVM